MHYLHVQSIYILRNTGCRKNVRKLICRLWRLSIAVLDISDDTAHNSANRFPRNRGLSRTAKGKGQHVEDEDDNGTNEGPNKRPRKEWQPNWDYEEVMEFIHAKEREHEKLKLNQDARDNMESAVTRWKKISKEIGKAGVSTYFRGGIPCQDKWGSLFTGYKKIADYSSGIGNNNSYFKMTSKQRRRPICRPSFRRHTSTLCTSV
jgi:hypothetical protein